MRLSTASREVNHNLERMLADGQHLDENPFWHFVMQNAPEALYQGYKLSLYGLVSPTWCACVSLQLFDTFALRAALCVVMCGWLEGGACVAHTV